MIIVANITCYDRIKTVREQECLSETLGKHKKHSSKRVKSILVAEFTSRSHYFLKMKLEIQIDRLLTYETES